MSELLRSLEGNERRAECAMHDEEDRQFDTNLHPIHHCNEGDCEEVRQASRASLLGLWLWIRGLTVEEVMCLVLAVVAIGAVMSK